MERKEQRRIVEALVLASTEPISSTRLASIIPGCKPGDAKDLVNELNTEYQEQDRSFEIWEVAGGYQMRTRAEFSGYLQRLQKVRVLRLSRAALDALAIVAYKQPVTRGEIDEIRGVDTGAVLKGLLDRRLVRIAGQREVPGRPMLYGTTRRFLEVFGLESLKGLPSLRELKDLASQKGVEISGDDEDSVEDSLEEQGEASVEGPVEVSIEGPVEASIEGPDEASIEEVAPEETAEAAEVSEDADVVQAEGAEHAPPDGEAEELVPDAGPS